MERRRRDRQRPRKRKRIVLKELVRPSHLGGIPVVADNDNDIGSVLEREDHEDCGTRATGLILETKLGHFEVIYEYLSASDVSRSVINAVDLYGMTAINYACRGGQIDIVRLLLCRGANPRIPNEEGTTPLMHSIFTGKLLLVRILVLNGANRFAKNGSGIVAADMGTTDDVTAFLKTYPKTIYESVLTIDNGNTKRLLNSGVLATTVDNMGTPILRMFLSEFKGRDDVADLVELLVGYGAAFEEVRKDGDAPEE